MTHRHLTHRIVALVFTCATVVCDIPTDAYAATGNIFSPFDIGTSWYVCQGYNGPVTHSASDRYALDLTKQLCDGSAQSNTSSAGATVNSPVDGTVYWYSSSPGALCINTIDTRSLLLVHIDSLLSSGTAVIAGKPVGSISTADTHQNGGIAHLHMQMWDKPNCYNGNAIPFDLAHSARICGAPDMTVNGPNTYNNGTWSGTSFTTRSCTFSPQKASGSIYRFWSSKKLHHFYTSSYSEAQQVADTWPDTWSYEPEANFVVTTSNTDNSCPSNTKPIYRFWSDKYQGHFYSINNEEKNSLINTQSAVWSYEGVAYCAALSASQTLNTPLFRFWSDTYHAHFYTSSVVERDQIINTQPGIWKFEGTAYYVGA